MSTATTSMAVAGAGLYEVATAKGHHKLAKIGYGIAVAAAALETSDNANLSAAIIKGTAREEDRFLLCVAWPANRLTAKGADGFTDVADARQCELGAWRFMLAGAKTGTNHRAGGENACKIVESYVYRPDRPWHITAPDGTTQTISKGDWVVGLLLSPAAWLDYKAGKFTGVSMQGKATRRHASPQVLASLRS